MKTQSKAPTSPHEFHQVTIFDIVAQVSDVDAILAFADFGEFDSLLVVGVDRTSERTTEVSTSTGVVFAVLGLY